MQAIERSICGGDEAAQAQRAFNLARSTQAEREQLLVSANVHHLVSPADSMSMAVNLRLTNDQMRKLRLWTKTWNVFLASERKTRSYSSEQMADVEVCSEMVQGISDPNNARCLHPAAFAWVCNPIALLCQHLESLKQRSLLTWHKREDGFGLPENEIWVKLGGDKGGGSFKFAMQVVNQPCPNSADYTVVLACLEAEDNLPNLHIALDSLQPIVSELQGMSWR